MGWVRSYDYLVPRDLPGQAEFFPPDPVERQTMNQARSVAQRRRIEGGLKTRYANKEAQQRSVEEVEPFDHPWRAVQAAVRSVWDTSEILARNQLGAQFAVEQRARDEFPELLEPLRQYFGFIGQVRDGLSVSFQIGLRLARSMQCPVWMIEEMSGLTFGQVCYLTDSGAPSTFDIRMGDRSEVADPDGWGLTAEFHTGTRLSSALRSAHEEVRKLIHQLLSRKFGHEGHMYGCFAFQRYAAMHLFELELDFISSFRTASLSWARIAEVVDYTPQGAHQRYNSLLNWYKAELVDREERHERERLATLRQVYGLD